jgi:antitoxin PrlF
VRRTATLTSKGQITVPIDVRRRLGLRQGDRVAFDVEDGTAVMRPLPPDTDGFTAYAGALASLPDEAAVHDWLHDLRDDD